MIQYIIDYFIRKPNIKVNYFQLLNLIKLSFNNLLSTLPPNYNSIPSEILIKLSSSLPIIKLSDITPIARSLKNFYLFKKLSQQYIQLLPPLLPHPSELHYEFQNIFPITNKSMLKDLSHHKNQLHNYYNFHGRLPESYFDLPPPKIPLPTTHQLLLPKFQKLFLYNSSISTLKFNKLVQELHSSYYFIKLPNDYFYIKPNLPSPEFIKDPNFTFLYQLSTSLKSPLLFLISEIDTNSHHHYHQIGSIYLPKTKPKNSLQITMKNSKLSHLFPSTLI